MGVIARMESGASATRRPWGCPSLGDATLVPSASLSTQQCLENKPKSSAPPLHFTCAALPETGSQEWDCLERLTLPSILYQRSFLCIITAKYPSWRTRPVLLTLLLCSTRYECEQHCKGSTVHGTEQYWLGTSVASYLKM